MFNLNSKSFEEALMQLINNSGLKVSEAYYIVQNAALQLKSVYDELCWKERIEGVYTEEKTQEMPINEELLNALNNQQGENRENEQSDNSNIAGNSASVDDN